MFYDAHEPERRARRRTRIASPCRVEALPSGDMLEAMLRELDEGGARIKLASRAAILSGQVRLTAQSTCKGTFAVVWQIGQQVGLRALAA